jgi:hypothetical protein
VGVEVRMRDLVLAVGLEVPSGSRAVADEMNPVSYRSSWHDGRSPLKADYGVWLYDDQHVRPARPEAGEDQPERAVAVAGRGSICVAGWPAAGEGQGSQAQGPRACGGPSAGIQGGAGSGQPSRDDAQRRTCRGQYGCSVIATVGKQTARMTSWRGTGDISSRARSRDRARRDREERSDDRTSRQCQRRFAGSGGDRSADTGKACGEHPSTHECSHSSPHPRCQLPASEAAGSVGGVAVGELASSRSCAGASATGMAASPR